jgi:hypothetical protein
MLWSPTKGRSGSAKTITNAGIVGTPTPGTGVPSNATTLLDGAVTELISAANNTQESWGLDVWITATGASATAAESCLDILIGGATDDVLIAALICGYSRLPKGAYHYFFPLHIPQGKRIAAVLASVRTSITSQVVITLYGGSPPPLWRIGRKVTTYGAQINNARGVAIVPAASGGAATATEIVASTTEDHFAFLPGFQPATDNTLTPDGNIVAGIGVGAATEDRIGTWWFAKTTGEDASGPFPFLPAFTDVPSGSRLTMLTSNSGANDAAYDGLIYAVS